MYSSRLQARANWDIRQTKLQARTLAKPIHCTLYTENDSEKQYIEEYNCSEDDRVDQNDMDWDGAYSPTRRHNKFGISLKFLTGTNMCTKKLRNLQAIVMKRNLIDSLCNRVFISLVNLLTDIITDQLSSRMKQVKPSWLLQRWMMTKPKPMRRRIEKRLGQISLFGCNTSDYCWEDKCEIRTKIWDGEGYGDPHFVSCQHHVLEVSCAKKFI